MHHLHGAPARHSPHSTRVARSQLQLAEIKNGRLAMLGITGMAAQEALYGTAVVAQTPWFFRPVSLSL